MKEAKDEILLRLLSDGHIDTDEFIILTEGDSTAYEFVIYDSSNEIFDFYKTNIA